MGRLTALFITLGLATCEAQVIGSPPNRIAVKPETAEALLIHREEPACQKDPDGTRVTGTVVVRITIGRTGKVIHTRTISGPKLLQPVGLAAVRKYLYRPYLLSGNPVEVVTIVSIPIDCIFHTGQA